MIQIKQIPKIPKINIDGFQERKSLCSPGKSNKGCFLLQIITIQNYISVLSFQIAVIEARLYFVVLDSRVEAFEIIQRPENVYAQHLQTYVSKSKFVEMFSV